MKLTNGQQKAYDSIMKWISCGDSWCYKLGGYAGTGKTTLLQYIISQLREMPICCSPTGKAASVLQNKLSNDAIVTTVHNVLYAPNLPNMERIESLVAAIKDDPENKELLEQFEKEKEKIRNQKLSFTSKVEDGDYKNLLIIVDEASMVGERMANDFHRSGAKVLFVGDPGQLPVVGDKDWFDGGGMDYVLEEVMRQAMDNPIIRLSMEIRERGRCNVSEYANEKNLLIAPKEKIPENSWLSANQILTGSNYLRRRINRFIRNKIGNNGAIPVAGEKLICLKNNLDEYGFINGVLAESLNDFKLDEFGELKGAILFENQVHDDISFYDYPFNIHYDSLAKERPWMMRTGLAEFDFAYAITVHKSQGSEWDNILLADDGFWTNKFNDRKRWLYTAITRAKQKLIWVTE